MKKVVFISLCSPLSALQSARGQPRFCCEAKARCALGTLLSLSLSRKITLKKLSSPFQTHRRPKLPRGGQVPDERDELVLPAPVRGQLHAPDEPDLDSGVLEALARRRGDPNLFFFFEFFVGRGRRGCEGRKKRAKKKKPSRWSLFSASPLSLSAASSLSPFLKRSLYRNQLSH